MLADPNYITNAFWYTMDGLNCVKNNMQLLAYGQTAALLSDTEMPYAALTPAVENRQPSVLPSDKTALVLQVMFEDACPFLATVSPQGAAFNITACETFQGGLLQQGLAAVVAAWWDAAYLVLDRQIRGDYWWGVDPNATVPGTTYLWEGLGWELPSDTYNYTSSQCIPPQCDLSISFAPPANGAPLPPTRFRFRATLAALHRAPMPVSNCTPYLVRHELASPNSQ